MQRDAFVIVIDSVGTLTYTVAKQMLGRSSRRRGNAIGKVLVRKTRDDIGTVGREVLLGREVTDGDDGATMLRTIVYLTREQKFSELEQLA